MIPVVGNQGGDIHIGNTIAIGEAKRTITHIIANAKQATSSHCCIARIDQGNFPRLGLLLMHLHRVKLHMKCNITHVQEVISKILLYYIPLVATANHKLVDAVSAIKLENMPKDWLAADLDHRLGLEMGFFANARTETTRKNDGFHNKNWLLKNQNNGNDLRHRAKARPAHNYPIGRHLSSSRNSRTSSTALHSSLG